MNAPELTRIGVVVIGRNESAALTQSLSSVSAAAPRVIYVDSGSTDDSVAVARRAGVAIHELDHSRPFSAARARNEGFDRLLASHPTLEAVQFVDGDCTIDPSWLARAVDLIGEYPDAAVVCGRLRERDPSASVYQRLCDIEWDLPPGVVEECGGVFAVRVKAFREVGGFDASRIAGEEPELCARLRLRNWKIRRTRDEILGRGFESGLDLVRGRVGDVADDVVGVGGVAALLRFGVYDRAGDDRAGAPAKRAEGGAGLF